MFRSVPNHTVRAGDTFFSVANCCFRLHVASPAGTTRLHVVDSLEAKEVHERSLWICTRPGAMQSICRQSLDRVPSLFGDKVGRLREKAVAMLASTPSGLVMQQAISGSIHAPLYPSPRRLLAPNSDRRGEMGT